ncbi:MAG TPA: GerMN domain-containing protein [Pyrinomonadaceae bacterium]|nr:GerMN domain-containing protein [Pyrinomonadaceae bacterium]
MKMSRVLALLISALVLATCLPNGSAFAQGYRFPRTRQVKVYFPKDGDSPDPQNNPSNLQPVTRLVNLAAPLRPAVEALLAGPTRAEERQGFMALDVSGLRIVKVAVNRGTAYASFAHRRGTGWAGDLSPFTFGDAVELTLKQFPNVRRTVVCVDGVTNFGDESGGPAKKCPRF